MPSAPSSGRAIPAVPRTVFWACMALVVSTLAVVLLRDRTDVASARDERIVPAVTLELRAIDRPDGTISLEDATTGETIRTLHAGEESFIRSTLRSLARERRIRGVDAVAPFTLTQQADGSVWLEDRAVGTRLAIAAYGHTQQEAFARLLGERRVRTGPGLVSANDSTRSIR